MFFFCSVRSRAVWEACPKHASQGRSVGNQRGGISWAIFVLQVKCGVTCDVAIVASPLWGPQYGRGHVPPRSEDLIRQNPKESGSTESQAADANLSSVMMTNGDFGRLQWQGGFDVMLADGILSAAKWPRAGGGEGGRL